MSEAKIYPAMISVMRQIGVIQKDQFNQQQRFNYRGIDDAYNAIHPLMSEAGIFTTSKILQHQRADFKTSRGAQMLHVILDMEYTFWAEDGSFVKTEVVGEGMDMMDKAANKAMAVADKYALLQAFKVPTEELKLQDPDRVNPVQEAHEKEEKVVERVPLISEKQAKFLHMMCDKLAVKDGVVKERFQIDSFKNIPKEHVQKVKTFILQKGSLNMIQVIEECEKSEELSNIGGPLISFYPEDSKTREKYDNKMRDLIAKESREQAEEAME